jgi:hypothetical protein
LVVVVVVAEALVVAVVLGAGDLPLLRPGASRPPGSWST